jgi:hypothetical protein
MKPGPRGDAVLDAKHFLDRVFIEGRAHCSTSRAEVGSKSFWPID